jgi:hypothetical protein
VSHGSDTTHSLHAIQYQTFGGKNRLCFSGDYKSNIAFLSLFTVFDVNIDFRFLSKVLKIISANSTPAKIQSSFTNSFALCFRSFGMVESVEKSPD